MLLVNEDLYIWQGEERETKRNGVEMRMKGMELDRCHTCDFVAIVRDFIARDKLADAACHCAVARCDFVAYKLNSTTRARPDPTGPARTRTDFVGDPHGPNGVSRRLGPQKSPFGSGRARVVEFSYIQTRLLHHFSRSTIFPRRQSCKMAQLFHIWSFLNSSIERTLSFCKTKLLASSYVGLDCLRDNVAACNCTVARSDFIAR